MTVYKRQDLPDLLKNIAQGEASQLYLIFGERYLGRQAATEILDHLMPDEKQRAGSLLMVDGDREEAIQTLNQLRTYSLFGGRRIISVMDSRLFHSQAVARPLWDKACRSHQKNDLEAAGRYLRQVLEIGDMTGSDLEELPEKTWKNKLGFARPDGDLSWVSEVLGKTDPNAKETPAAGKKKISDQYMEAFDAGLPGGNTLILVTETVDKRKKFYKYISSKGTVLDLSVDTGFSQAATTAQKEVLADIVSRTLAGFNKKIDSPRTLDIFLERVGFHPVAAALESEKLAFYTEDRDKVTVADLNEVVGRTREEAVFELSEAFSNRDLATALLITGRLIENGLHPLAIIGTLRNHIRKLLLISAMQDLDSPAYSSGLSFPAFKGGYLERLKAGHENWPKELSGHPYALYMMFKKAEKFSTAELKRALAELLETEYSLKGSGLPEKIALESLFFRLLGSAGQSRGRRAVS
jgi:DNA polymerase-3 subunit delta